MAVTNASVDIIDADFNLVYVNPAWERQYGPAAGRKCYAYFMGRDRMCPDCRIPEALRTRQPQVAEHVMVRENGRVVQVHTVPFQTPTGEWQVAEFNLDITAHRRTIEELRSERNLLQAVMDVVPDRFYVKDVKGRYVLANRVTLALLGVPDLAALAGRTDMDLAAPGASARSAEDEEVVRSGRPVLNAEEGLPDEATGVTRVFLMSKVPFRDARGAVAGMVAIGRDVTDRKALELQMREMQRLESLGVLTGGIAHDFNNILQTILGNADLVAMDQSLSTFNRDCVESISRAGFRMAELTRQMLAYSGAHRFELRPVALNDVVREMRSLLEVAVSKKAALFFEMAEDLPAVRADPDQLHQVVLNLVTNAVEAVSGSAGRITVSTGRMRVDAACLARCALNSGLEPGEYVFLRVEDTGCGMSEEVKAKMFDPFFSTKFIGRGMGLPAVLGIIRGHGGAIHVESEVGRGSALTILFRAAEPEPAATAAVGPAPAAEAPVPAKAVLIVDDEKSVRDVAQRMLARAGFEVWTAADGEEAVALFRERGERVGVVLLDLTMPNLGGEETFAALRAIRPDVPVLMVSGYNEAEATERLAGRNLNGFIQKPFQMAALIAAVRKGMGI
jgi:PAS domain S-box-containing protein